MKKLAFVTILVALLNTNAAAQSVPGAADTAIMEIKQLTTKWYDAIKNRDSVTLNWLLTDDYTINGSWPKSKWMNNILHHFKMDSFEVVGNSKFSYYTDAVISEGLLYWKGTNDGNPFMNAEFKVTDIWVYRQQRWQIHMRMLKFLKNI